MRESRLLPRVRFAVAAGILCAGAAARAQATRRYAEEPTDGVLLPATPLAGEQDARAVVINPGGLWWLDGQSLVAAFGVTDHERADSSGPGVGGFAGTSIGGGVFPRLAVGAALEWLRPPGTLLLPDPGNSVRYTLAAALPLGRLGSFGMSWHHWAGDGAMGGVDSFDAGYAARIGNAIDAGAVVRDLNAPVVAGAPVQRRYELEVGWRPTGTDALSFSIGGQIGEVRGDVDGWLRGDVKLTRGVWLHAQLETRALHVVDTTPIGTVDSDDRDLRGVIGLEVSFGRQSVLGWGVGGLDREGDSVGDEAGGMVRWEQRPLPSVIPPEDRIERVEIGALGDHGLIGVVMRLRAIEHDPHVKAVVFAFEGAGGGTALLGELRAEILKVKASGKRTYAYMVAATGRDYWVATACDKIYVDPGGGIRLIGMAGTTIYFKGLFDQLGVNAQFEKIAEYKSAPETFTETGPTEPALRMRNELYDSIWSRMADDIAAGRGIDRAAVDQIVANGPYTAGDLMKDKRLVDAVGEPDAISAAIVKDLGAAYPVTGAPATRPERWQPPQIAVVYIEGDIVDGPSRSLPIGVPFLGQEMAGSDTIIAAIQAARAAPRVKAIIIRIDSPGGSALASDLIAREIKKTRGVKPIICSMGDLAASGGYYVAAYCDRIIASPTTITGSIGIFTGKFDVSGLLEKLGVTSETFTRGPRADMESYFRPYTDEERQVLHEKLTYLYGRFTGAVAEGRAIDEKKVDEIGRGHVWSGAQALPIHLVDALGGFSDALDLAKARGGLAPDDVIQLVELPRPSSDLLSKLLQLAGLAQASASASVALPSWARAVTDALPASIVAEPDVPQARLDFNVEWK
jgi:protease-4